jgi:hypothetical protein
LVKGHHEYHQTRVYVKTAKDRIEEWFNEIADKYDFTSDERVAFDNILEDL